MMKRILTIILLIMSVMTLSAQKNAKKVTDNSYHEVGRMFVYGVGYTPGDSIVYMTDLLYIENAQLTKRDRFLVNRNHLSIQLRSYLASVGKPNQTCCVTFHKNLNSIDKAYRKQLAWFKKKGILVLNVDQTKFRFETVRGE